MFFGNISKNKKYFFMVVFAPPSRVFNTTFVKISKVFKKIKISKYFEQLFFPRFFRFFEVCSSGDLVDFLDVSSAGDLEGISERILLRILIMISKRISIRISVRSKGFY